MSSFRSIVAGLALTVAFTSGCGLPHEKAYESINASKVGTLTGDVGLQPGIAAPDAQLLDTKGRPVTLSDVRANRPTALVFYRGLPASAATMIGSSRIWSVESPLEQPCNSPDVLLHLPGSMRFYRAMAGLSGLPQLLAVAVDHGTLPPRPSRELDAYLDAVEICVRRYGWSRTSPQDIAREAGVNRTTIYRVLGAKDTIFHSLIAREVHRLIDDAVRLGAELRARGERGADAIIELTASAIEQVRDNPTIAKLLADEPELVAGFMRDGIPRVLERFTDVLGPLLGVAMDSGIVARRDPKVMTEWMVRMGLSLLFAPPRCDLRAFLGAGVRPLFDVDGWES